MYVVVVKDAPTEDEEEEDKEEDKEEEEDKGRDEREPPQRSTTKTAHVDTTTYYECRLYLFILTQHFFYIMSHSFLHFALKLLYYERKVWKGAVLKKRFGRCCSTFE